MKKDVTYLRSPETRDDYARSECKLDVYLPTEGKAFPLLVWFHGGALQGGSKNSPVSTEVAKSLAARGICVVLPEYRKNPKVKYPAYIQDCAEAVRWAIEHTDELGAQPKIFVGGHSAGGYLAALLAMNPRFFQDEGVKAEQIAGFIAMSGQLSTHATVAEERGFDSKAVTSDDAAPMHYTGANLQPFLLLVGDDDWPARLEENRYFYEMQRKVAGNKNISFFVMKDRSHGGILKQLSVADDPAAVLLLEFMRTGKLPEDGEAPVKLPAAETLVDPTVIR